MKRLFRGIAIFLVSILGLTCLTPGLALARSYYGYPPPPPGYGYNYGYGYNHYYYYDYDRDRHHRSNKGWLWGAAGIGILAWILGSSSHHSNKTYSEKLGDIVSKFNSEEIQVYRVLTSAPKGQVSGISYYNQKSLNTITNVFKKLNGEYIYMGSYKYNGKYIAAFYKFSQIYENKKLCGKYEDFVAIELLNHLRAGNYHLSYNKSLLSSLSKYVGNYSYNSYCYRDGDYIILVLR